MPEGHTLHRLAGEHQREFRGRVLHADSPQGRFVEGAEAIDGQELAKAEAFGKHLVHHYREPGSRKASGPILHVHLGLFGKFRQGTGEPPAPTGALRLRLTADDPSPRGPQWAELRGPTACEIWDPTQLADLIARLGPDPLRPDGDPDAAFRRISRSNTEIGALLMDQKVVAGVGNVYRAEILYRHGVSPFRPGRTIDAGLWQEMWLDLVHLMRAGVRVGRIETVRPEDRPHTRRLTRSQATYVYRHAGEPCRICGTEVALADMQGRNLFWCPTCQPR